jgi:two-component system, NarL family, response regulator NreC
LSLPIRLRTGTRDLEQAKRVTQILIADGNMLFRSGLRTLFSAESEFHVTDEACDAAEAMAKLRVTPPDVLIMDLALVGVDGQQTAFALRQRQPSTAILFLTRQDEPELLRAAVGAGARGYMLKDSTPNQLIAAVREVAKGSDDGNPAGLSRIMPDLQALAQSNQGYTRGSVLTPREQEVMRLLAEGRTVREVASELSLSVKTIEAHKLNLMRKLDIHNRASLVEYAIQTGVIVAAVTR